MNHGLPFAGSAKVWAGTYEDCRDADIIIITAGAAQKTGENRIDLLKRNGYGIAKDCVRKFGLDLGEVKIKFLVTNICFHSICVAAHSGSSVL